MAENSAGDLKKFFDTPEKKLTTQEFMEFWSDLSEEEKDYYKSADLS
jgi:hypothetical protein